MTRDPTWNFQDPASKNRLLGVLRREIDEMFELAAEATRWHTPTACPGWEIRDMIGDLLDATHNYLTGFDIASHRTAAPEPVGVAGMANASDVATRAFRSEPRDELLTRLRADTDRLLGVRIAHRRGMVRTHRYRPLPGSVQLTEAVYAEAVVFCRSRS